MKKRVLALLCALAVAGSSSNVIPVSSVNAAETVSVGTTYYISSKNGDNSNDGTSEKTAWETLDMLKDIDFQPGDQILLEKGSVFNGYIHLKDVHGTEEAPIIISSYGSEDGAKPIIDANGQGVWYQDYQGTMDNNNHQSKGYVSSTILLYDVDFVEVSDLEIVNTSDDFDYFEGATTSVSKTSGRMDRTGVAGIAKDDGTMQHIYLDNLYIHDVDGNIQDKHMDNGGIQMNVLPPSDEAATGIARYDDVKITNCYVKDVSRAGICVGYTYNASKFNGAAISDETAIKYGHTNIVLEGNYVQNAGNDALVAMYSYQPLVQYNVSDTAGSDLKEYSGFWQPLCAAIWPWKCKDAVFQYNEVFDTVDNQDGQSWDIDYSDGTIYQYNYSHNNGGGCIMFCGSEAYNGVFRYNISQNDLKGLISLAGNPNGEIYNNVFYIDGDLSTTAFRNNYSGSAVIENNIFYNVSTNKSSEDTIVASGRTYSNNLFYGYSSTLPDGSLTQDPKFVDPGSAPTTTTGTIHDTSVFAGYKLQADSPAINAGVTVDGAPKYDFFGNTIGIQPDLGVYESDTAETVLGLAAATYTVSDGVIKNVPSGTTVADLKEDLSYTKGATLSVLDGGKEAADDAKVKETMTVKVTMGSETKSYSISLEKNYTEYDPTTMTATAGSEQSQTGSEGPAADVLDNDTTTLWHTNWNGCAQSDVWITLDLKSSKPVAMLKYVPRQSGGVNGIITKYRVEVSDDNTNWTTVDEGTWSSDATTKYATFTETNARYVRLTGLESATQTNSLIFGSAAEIRVGYEAE